VADDGCPPLLLDQYGFRLGPEGYANGVGEFRRTPQNLLACFRPKQYLLVGHRGFRIRWWRVAADRAAVSAAMSPRRLACCGPLVAGKMFLNIILSPHDGR